MLTASYKLDKVAPLITGGAGQERSWSEGGAGAGTVGVTWSGGDVAVVCRIHRRSTIAVYGGGDGLGGSGHGARGQDAATTEHWARQPQGLPHDGSSALIRRQ